MRQLMVALEKSSVKRLRASTHTRMQHSDFGLGRNPH